MTDILVLARRDAAVRNVIRNMRDNGVRRLPVVDETDELVGIVTLDDLIREFGSAFSDLAELVERGIIQEIDGR